MAEIWLAVQRIPRAASKALLQPQYFPACAAAVFLLEMVAVPAIILLVPCEFEKGLIFTSHNY